MANETENPRQIVRAFIHAMEKADFDTGLNYVSEDVEYINSPNTAVRGHAGVRQVLEPFFAPIEENDFRILREIAQGDLVVLERLDRHRVPRGWFELPVTGVFEVKNGKIRYWREYFDVATILQAMEKLMGGEK